MDTGGSFCKCSIFLLKVYGGKLVTTLLFNSFSCTQRDWGYRVYPSHMPHLKGFNLFANQVPDADM